MDAGLWTVPAACGGAGDAGIAPPGVPAAAGGARSQSGIEAARPPSGSGGSGGGSAAASHSSVPASGVPHSTQSVRVASFQAPQPWHSVTDGPPGVANRGIPSPCRVYSLRGVSLRSGGSGVDDAGAEPSFIEWLREEMRRREWRQADFARAAGIDVSMVSRWLRGRRPDPASLERVATALGMDLDALLTLAGHRPRMPRDDDPRVAALVAKIRQVQWTPERFLILDALLDDLRHRSSRVPIEQVPLPGMEDAGDGVIG